MPPRGQMQTIAQKHDNQWPEDTQQHLNIILYVA